MKRPLTIIHVNQHVIKANRKTGARAPVITIKKKSGGPVTRARRAQIVDDRGRVVAEVVYNPDKPLKCGAVCWIETTQSVVALGKEESCLTGTSSAV